MSLEDGCLGQNGSLYTVACGETDGLVYII